MQYSVSQRVFLELAEEIRTEGGFKYALCDESKEKMLQICDLADRLVADLGNDGDQVMVSLSPGHSVGDGVVWLEMDEIVLGREEMYFFDKIGAADKLNFSKSKNERLKIEFTVNDLWVLS